MNLAGLKALVAQHRENPIRFPADTPESFWLGYDAAMADFVRVLDDEIAFGEKGHPPGDFIIELEPMIPAGRGLWKKAPQRQIINMLPKLVENAENALARFYEGFRPNLKAEMTRARANLAWAEERLRSLNAEPVTDQAKHSNNPEWAVKFNRIAEQSRTFLAENVGV
jgi:hypothetical protein